MVHIGIGKFGQWNTDSDLVEEYTNALKLKEDLPAGDWRVDTYKTHDNLGLWLDKSCLQYFGSTAAPSILSFYPALGVKRDVRSEPELSNYALRGLLSVKYLLTTQKHQEDFLAEADEGWSYYDTRDGYLLYENENYVPMGFTYDYYLTESQYENTIKTTRSNLLMRALVLKDEDAETYSEYLQPLPEERLNDLYYDTYVEDCDARRATASRVFTMTNSGFHAEIDLTRENLVFFSVPYDDGFTAYVNGDYHAAAEIYEGILAQGLSSVKLYYNLANAYFKEGQLGKSILFYRRALRLAPGNDDIRYNLSVAEARTKDNIEDIPEFFFVTWMREARHTMSCTAWSVLSLVLLACALALFLVYLLAQRLSLRKAGFYGTVVAVLLCMLTTWFALGERREMLDDTSAVVMTASTAVKSSPDKSSTDLFVLHEGTVVTITNRLDDWCEVVIADGKKGWLECRKIETI
mgnify:CR=1 FL=1